MMMLPVLSALDEIDVKVNASPRATVTNTPISITSYYYVALLSSAMANQ
jgi:hypothetical protein